MTPSLRLSLAAAAVGLMAAGCGNSTKHKVDGDTGAAAPATTRDMSATPTGPDSTAAVSTSTGGGAMAGTTDTTKRPGASGTPAKP